MDEVPLTDAIKNLARQAGLNYMLDPKINYGAVGADGHVTNPQPSVSLRWENLTADQALNAVLNNYNLIIVDDPKSKISRITIKDPAAPDPLTTKIVQLKYAYATNLLLNAQAVLLDKRSKVMADVRTSQLVVVATDKEMAVIDELIARLDTPTKQVLIEAKLVETTKNPTSAKGIDWSGTMQAQHFAFGNNVLGGQSGSPYLLDSRPANERYWRAWRSSSTPLHYGPKQPRPRARTCWLIPPMASTQPLLSLTPMAWRRSCPS